MRYAVIKTLNGQFPVSLMSRVFDVGKSGYYAWLKRAPSRRTQDNMRLEVAIKVAHVRTRESYGPERLQSVRYEQLGGTLEGERLARAS